MGQAAATQCVNAAIAMALAQAELRRKSIPVRNPVASNAADPALFSMTSWQPEHREEGDMVVVLSTSQMVYNANPTKLGTESIRSAAKKLAKIELEREAISERMASANYMLTALCRSVAGGWEIDAVWAAFVLVVYVGCDPRSRALLKDTGLTDLDVQTAYALEAYGRGEITRRARLRAQQQEEARKAADKQNKKQKKDGDPGPSSPPAPDAKEEEEDDDSEFEETDPDTGLPIEDDTASIVNDDGDESDDGVDLEAAGMVDEPIDMLGTEQQDQKVLATKRKRSNKGGATASTSDSHGILTWWYKALRCKDKSVLETLICQTKTNAREAAQATLEIQTEGTSIPHNRVIVAQSAANAVKSAQALVPFVDRKAKDVPTWVAFSTRDTDAKCAVGLGRVPDESRNSVLHACRQPPNGVMIAPHVGIGVLWSVATQELVSRRNDASYAAVGVLERYAMLAKNRAQNSTPKGVFKTPFQGAALLRVSALERHIDDETMRALPSAPGGLTRSFINLKTVVTVHDLTFQSGHQLAAEGLELYQKAAMMHGGKHETDRLTTETLGTSANPNDRIEPYCTPATRLAVGLRLNELLRRFMQGRSRKNEPCKVLLGYHTHAEVGRDVPPIMDTEPIPLATITDFNVRVEANDYSARNIPESEPIPCEHVPASISLHVCLDGAIRAPEMIASLGDNLWQKRALLLVGSSQASYIGDVGVAISAAAANANINSSKKISCADINTLALLSIWDVYGGGLTNIHRSFANTPYTGCYGSTLDTGITAPGLLGHFYRSDRRGHGSMTLSTEVADELAAQLAHTHHVEVGDKKYALTPVQTRGIPHGYVPGVHTLLSDYVEAVDGVARSQGREDADTCNCLQVLPFSNVTQALRPDVETTADHTLRQCFRQPQEISSAVGRSYLPDATAEHEAIVTEPLFRRPCQACVGDNPFATSYPYADSVWNVLNALAIIARECGGVDKLHARITEWHAGESDSDPPQANPTSCADACVLIFGVIYPHQHGIAKPVVPECYAKALPYCVKASRTYESGGVGAYPYCGHCMQSDWELVSQARELWSRFSTRPAHLCPWKVGIAPMLSLILRVQGSHDLTLEQIGEFRNCFNTLCSKAAWLAYSEDGFKPPKAPNPAAGCATMNDVRRPTLDPVFVAQGEALEIEPRGCLVGLVPFQLRQVYSLMLGAHLEHVDQVQCVRNEGGLLLRESSQATIIERDGKKRSSKGISPTQTESDQAAYGTRKAKVYGAALQLQAWDANAKLISGLICEISPPMSKEWRGRGEFGDASWLRQYLSQQYSENRTVHYDEARAKRKIEEASASLLTQRAMEATL